MSEHNRKYPEHGGICRDCSHDLVVRTWLSPTTGNVTSDGEVICSNDACRYHGREYPLTNRLNDGKQAA